MATRSQRGFTLIEILMALAVMSLMLTALYQSMASSFEAKDIVSKLNDRYHEGRQVMGKVARELRMAFLRAEVPEQFREEKPTVLTRFKGQRDELYFASTAHLRLRAGARESDQTEIAYFLGPSPRDTGYRGKTLFRRESRRIDGKPERGGYIWPVVDGVKEFQLEYWDDTKEIAGDAWQRDWDSHENEAEPLLPARVRITLELESPLNPRRPLRFVTQAAPRIRRPINVIDAQVVGRATTSPVNAATLTKKR
jgi:general secretion pathway protein J